MSQICSGMPIRIARQFGYAGIVEKSLNRHDNHSGICGPVLRTMRSYAMVGRLILEDVYNDHTFYRTYYRCSSLHDLCCGMRIKHDAA